MKQAAIVIQRLEARLAGLEQAEQERNEPIAIVGIGCRFPGGAASPEAFWELLEAGRDAVQPLERRWALVGAQPSEDVPRWAGLLTEAVEGFDAAFFGVAPREARSLDPQHRLLLEVVWEALEDAGVPLRSLDGSRTGVFVGAWSADYLHAVTQQPPDQKDAYGTTGNMLSIAAGRLSYTLGLQGPCLTVDTACSSSLVAIHLACRSLRARESDLTLAGGVNMLLSPDTMENVAHTQALSPDGRCRAFDASASGFVRGEGCGLVVLKRLSDAQRDGDRIWALIRGSAINQDGRSTGLTAPNVLAQQALLREALQNARVEAGAIGYVETHGTGTSLGDPIEVEALREVVGQLRPDGTRCVLGAVKTNIGHLESAAGVAGLIKAALSLHHERISKNLNFRTLNPRIRLEETALALATEPVPWPRTGRPRFAGVSSFGMSGTNAHVVLEEAPAAKPAPPAQDRAAEVMLLSAKSEAALDAQAAGLRDHLNAHPEIGLADVAFSLATTRSAMDHRLAVAATSREALQTALDAAARGQTPAGASRAVAASSRGKLAFLFTGQGAQAPGMGRALHEAWPAFRSAFDRCASLFDNELDQPLREVMWAEPGSHEALLLDQTGYTQPALFALEYALFVLWRSWGVEPELVAGHSIGELVAACVAGVFSLEDAVRLVAARGRLMQALPAGGAMVSVAAPEAEVLAAVASHATTVSIAGINGPAQVVIAGVAGSVQAIAASFASRGVRTKALRVSHAFHSPLMDPMLEAFGRVAASVTYRQPSLSLVSNLTGKLCTDEVMTAAYWVRHVREAVRFAAGVKALHEAGTSIFVEVGPKATLLGLVPACLPEARPTLVTSLRAERDEVASMAEALGGVWTAGRLVDWSGVFPAGGRRVPLPTYPWQRERHWLERGSPLSGGTEASSWSAPTRHPFLRRHLRGPRPDSPAYWEGELGTKRFPYLADHRVGNVVVLPGTGYLEMILEAAEDLFGRGPAVLAGVGFHHPLFLPAEGERSVKVSLHPTTSSAAGFEIHSRPAAEVGAAWTLHVTGRVERLAGGQASTVARAPNEILSSLPTALDPRYFYDWIGAAGMQYGSSFQAIRELRYGGRELMGRIELPDALARDSSLYACHPVLLDACFQVIAGCLLWEGTTGGRSSPFVFLSAEEIRFRDHAGTAAFSLATLREGIEGGRSRIKADVQIFSNAGEIVVEARGIELRLLDYEDQSLASDDVSDCLYEIHWEGTSPQQGANGERPGAWLVLEPEGGGAAHMLEGLSPGARCIRVQPGARFARHSAERFTLDPSRFEDFKTLVDAVRVDGSLPLLGVIHLGGVAEGTDASISQSSVGAAAMRLCLSTLHLLRALDEVPWAEPPKVWLVTRGSQRVVDGDGVPGLVGAPLWGLGKSIAAEHASFWGGLIDLDPKSDPADDASALQWIWRTADGEDHLAARRGSMYTARLRRRVLEGSTGSLKLRPDASYLITGGLGELGMIVARWMAQQGARHLILLGRHGLPVREEWRRIAADGLIGHRIAAVLEVERLGASVTVVQADVADEAAMTRFVDAHERASRPPIAGVIHAAGTAVPRLLVETDAETFAAQFTPKVQGSCVLDRLFADRELSFLVYFSSASSILPSPRIGAYAAANSFMDALAHHQRAVGRAATSINWGFWQAGMAVRDIATESVPRGTLSIAQQPGLELLGRLMSEAPVQVVAMPMKWGEWFEFHADARGSSMLSGLREGLTSAASPAVAPTERGELRNKLSAAPPRSREGLLLDHVVQQVSMVLRLPIEQFNVRMPFGSMGLDSLMAMEVRNRLESTLGVTLSVTMVWNYPTAESLVPYLIERMGLDVEEPRAPGEPAGEPERWSAIEEELVNMSDADAGRLLMEELAGWAGKNGERDE